MEEELDAVVVSVWANTATGARRKASEKMVLFILNGVSVGMTVYVLC